MTKTIAITAIVLVAVVMGLSTIVPALQQAFAHDVIKDKQGARGICPAAFGLITFPFGQHPDHNMNGHVCVRCPSVPGIACPVSTLVVIDDNLERR